MIPCDQWIRLAALSLMLACPVLADSSRTSNERVSTSTIDSVHRRALGGELTRNLRPTFEPNVGQADSQVRFLSRSRGAQLFLTNQEAVLRVGTSTSAILRLQLQGANLHVEPKGVEPEPGHSNYFVGSDPRSWHRSVSHFARVVYPEVYPGIDLAFHSAGRDFEYDFILQPGRNPQVIAVDFVGATHLRIDSEGNLVLATAAGDVYQKKPVAFQVKQNRRISVEAAYVLKGQISAGFQWATTIRACRW